MQKSLFDAYAEYGEFNKSYYNIDINASKMFSGRKSENNNCYCFINKHFTNGSKESAMCTPWRRGYKAGGKHTHTVSLYLLTLLIEKESDGLLQIPLKEKIYSYAEWGDFKYTWFLTSLYHDNASHFEQVKQSEDDFCCPSDLESHLKRYKIQHTIYNHTPLNHPVWEPRFPQELLYRYFRVQIAPEKAKCDEDRDSERDHGILGGYFLFDSLYKNFTQKTQGHDWSQNPVKVIEGLQWRLAHLDHFAYISDAIICHNLWTANTWNPAISDYNDQLAQANKYMTTGLQDLIIDTREKRVSFQKYPLQFLLYLFDSIEPVKGFTKDSNRSAREVLQNISIEYCQNEDRHTIKLSWTTKFSNYTEFNGWYAKILKLKYWMDIEIQEVDGTIVLSFPKWVPQNSFNTPCSEQTFEPKSEPSQEDDDNVRAPNLDEIL